ncbi:MAG: hypothetical protein DRQ88_03535 [Epsilonproteobacteria bacterium]|nr:MAG: hypothetical protein DRQ89_03955 [Campylobacterota bacterium]RLA67246.1 MAG: hypothetical protein DRQ88_03535 [Campylobacterota bacterium]
MIQNKNIGNSRFVFFKLKSDFNKWQGILGQIDNFIRDNSGFERATPYAFIWFLPENVYWIGREVIGSIPIKGKNDPYVLDFKMDQVYSHSIDLELDWKLADLLDLRKKVCQENVGVINDHFPWRLCIDLEKRDKIHLEIEFYRDNYPFPKLTN